MTDLSPRPLRWLCRDRTIEFGSRSLVMGILNCTPDSFSDGGHFPTEASAVAHGLSMLEEGADIIDVGGESTRPGAAAVTAEEELERVVPVIRELRQRTDRLISVDTRKSVVARAACAAGADIINDVSGATDDPDLLSVVREDSGAGLVVMHMQGNPATMQQQPRYGQVVGEVRDYLAGRLTAAEAAGVHPEQVAIDPGIGFGKTLEHNVDLLAGIPEICRLGRPVLLGVSRKSFLQALTGRSVADRLPGSIAANTICALQGAHILRVHDVKETCDLVSITDMFISRWSSSNT